MLQKNCLVCDASIVKPTNETLQRWYTRHKFCSTKCRNKANIGSKGFWTGKKLYPETLLKMSNSLKGRNAWNKGLPAPRGEDSPAWKGGFIPINKAIRLSRRYKEKWQRPVLERDNRTCQLCGTTQTPFHVDHKKRLSDILRENNIRTMKQAYEFPLIWDTDNGRTLCLVCHKAITFH